MNQVEVYFKSGMPIDIKEMMVGVGDKDFSRFFSGTDNEAIEQVWSNLLSERGGNVFSKPAGLGNLYNAEFTHLDYTTTDFRTYIGVSLTAEKRTLSPELYDEMRVSAVGGAVRLTDGQFFVHRRPANATHVPNMLDSSVAGFCYTNGTGGLQVEKCLLEKLSRELHIQPNEIESMGLTDVHSSREPDFSGMMSFAIRARLDSREVKERIDGKYSGEFHFIPEEQLVDFVVDHFAVQKDMLGDGAAALLSYFPRPVFTDAVRRINKKEISIRFGDLQDGVFKERA